MGDPVRRTMAMPTAVVAAGLWCAAGALGQSGPTETIDRLLTDRGGIVGGPVDFVGGAPGEQGALEIGLSLRQSFLNANNAGGRTSQVWQTRGQVSARWVVSPAHEVAGVLSLDYREARKGDTTTANQPDGEFDDTFVPVLRYRFDAQRAGLSDTPMSVWIGRDRVRWHSGAVLDNDLIGAVLQGETAQGLGFAVVGGITAKDSTIDFDGSRPDFDDETERVIVGALLRSDANRRVVVEGSIVGALDVGDNDAAVLVAGGQLLPTEFEYDAVYGTLGVRGRIGERWQWNAEGIYQWGRSTSNPFDYDTGSVIEPTRERISAWAMLGDVRYAMQDDAGSELHARIIAGSGDRDRVASNQTLGGNASGTTDRAFNALGFVETGLALSPDVSNMLIVSAGGSTGSAVVLGRQRWRVSADAFLYNKIESSAGVSFPTEEGSRFVGAGLDLGVRYDILSDVRLDVRYGLFLPGEAMPSDADVRHLIYVGLSYAF